MTEVSEHASTVLRNHQTDQRWVPNGPELVGRMGVRFQHDGTPPMEEAKASEEGEASIAEPVHELSDPGLPARDERAELFVTVNEPPGSVLFPDLRAVARSREVLYFLTWRDVKVRYKQTAIG
ncbi:MAG: hypothetical protein ABI862_21800, partial [Ilumatobacteraceae bacterium]